MNKRIQELTTQCNFTDQDIEDLGPGLEKFAELIIKECCDIFVELRTRPADLAVKDIKQIFGVK